MRLFINIEYALSILVGLWLVFLLIDLIAKVIHGRYFDQSNNSDRADEYSVKAYFEET